MGRGDVTEGLSDEVTKRQSHGVMDRKTCVSKPTHGTRRSEKDEQETAD